jgi:hypothetical protein
MLEIVVSFQLQTIFWREIQYPGSGESRKPNHLGSLDEVICTSATAVQGVLQQTVHLSIKPF